MTLRGLFSCVLLCIIDGRPWGGIFEGKKGKVTTDIFVSFKNRYILDIVRFKRRRSQK